VTPELAALYVLYVGGALLALAVAVWLLLFMQGFIEAAVDTLHRRRFAPPKLEPKPKPKPIEDWKHNPKPPEPVEAKQAWKRYDEVVQDDPYQF